MSELGARVTALELAEWQAYFEIEGAVTEQVAAGVDPTVANELAWRERDDE